MKIGIGRPENRKIAISDYVLGKFNADEKTIMDQVIDEASEAAISFIFNDINYVMNFYNKKVK